MSKIRSQIVYAIRDAETGDYDDGDGDSATWPNLHFYFREEDAKMALLDFEDCFDMRVVPILISELTPHRKMRKVSK